MALDVRPGGEGLPGGPGGPWSIEKAPADHFPRNFIRTAVCELRFPTLFELESDRPPAAFNKVLRKEYPTYELLRDLKVGGAGVAHSVAHAFRSKQARWSVTLRPSAVTLETTQYESFAGFQQRLAVVVKAAASVIDSDFFTRIGLRYINMLPCGRDSAGEWVRPELVALLASGAFGELAECSGRVRGRTSTNDFALQYGLGNEVDTYAIDIDVNSEEMATNKVAATVDMLHQEAFALFRWCVTEHTITELRKKPEGKA